MNLKIVLSAAALTAVLLTGCDKLGQTDISEVGQQVDDMTASIDEGGGTLNGKLALFQIHSDPRINTPSFWDHFRPKEAHAAECKDASFNTCTAGVIERDFGGCSIGGATLTGKATITFAPTTDCALNADGDKATRVPDITLTGLRGATLTITKTGSFGQELTRNSKNNYSFRSGGITRKFTTPAGVTLLDFTTTVDTVTVTGENRANRTLSGGPLTVTNNLNGDVCALSTTTDLQWVDSCNCPTSGKVEGTCTPTSGEASKVSVEFTSCRGRTITKTTGTKVETETYEANRCYSL